MTIGGQNLINSKTLLKSYDNNVFNKFQNRKHDFANNNSAESQKTNKHDNPFSKYPIRALAYTNEVGAALEPSIGLTASHVFWIPALLYFGADIWDKYKKGLDDTYQNPDKRTGVRTAVFQTLASVFAPTYAIKLAHNNARKWGGTKFVDKTFNKLNNQNSIITRFIKKMPFGEKAVKFFKDSDIIKKPLETTGKKAAEEFDKLKRWGALNVGKRRLVTAYKTAIGFAMLAVVAIPIDMFTEKLIIKKVVNPALGLNKANKPVDEKQN